MTKLICVAQDFQGVLTVGATYEVESYVMFKGSEFIKLKGIPVNCFQMARFKAA